MGDVLIFLADGFEEIEFCAPVDILRRGNIPVKTVSITGSREVKSARELCVIAEFLFEEIDFEKAEMIVLPGGPGHKQFIEFKPLGEKIKEFHKKEKRIAALCASPVVLAGLGLLQNKNAVCFPGMEEILITNGATLVNESVVRDGNILTGRGPGAAIDFSFAILEIIKGSETANRLKKEMTVL